MAEFVYQMYKARKAVGEKVILDDVTVGVYPGAKIGVVGPNGMGKSTLLKVIAGMEDVSNGEAKLTPGYTVGLLQQEPPLDETKTVKENIELAFGDLLAKIARFNEIGVEMGNPDAEKTFSPRVLVHVCGMRMVNLDNFAGALDDPHQKQLRWAAIKQVPPLGEPY